MKKVHSNIRSRAENKERNCATAQTNSFDHSLENFHIYFVFRASSRVLRLFCCIPNRVTYKQCVKMFVDSFARSGDVVFSYSRKAVNVTEMEMFRGKNKMQIVFELSRDVNY